ncbi:MAG: hypothetical protein KM310_11040 [Clostridiales bacterium]|nr:hypothetical protein [Clostridiales bacterium]
MDRKGTQWDRHALKTSWPENVENPAGNNDIMTRVSSSIEQVAGLFANARIVAFTHISGSINGTTFYGSGIGILDTNTSFSWNKVVLHNFPLDFASPLCKSWKCKRHSNLVPGIDGDYDVDEVIKYSAGAEGEILSHASVRVVTPTIRIVINRFTGWYKGPINVQEIRPYWEEYRPTDNPNVVSHHGERTSIVSGTEVTTAWTGTIKLLDPKASFSQAHRLDYVMHDWSWHNEGGTAEYFKVLGLHISRTS